MQTQWLAVASLLTVVMLTACNNAKSPDAVASDTAAAQQRAAVAVADARQDAARDNSTMEAKVNDKSAELANTEAKGAYDVALNKAAGTHDVTIQQCQALAGDAQKKCMAQADADYDTARAAAKSVEISRTQ